MISNLSAPFGPLVTAMVTPFGEDSSVDLKAVEHIVAHLIATGSTAVVVTGTTGESPTLDDNERKVLYRLVKEKAHGKIKVLAGVGTNSTAKTIKYAHLAEGCGADGLLIVTPYYNKPPQAGLVKHYQEIAKNTNLPIMLYNVPGRTSVNLGVDATIEIAETCSKVVALKDSTGSTDQTAEMAGKIKRKDFWIYTGDDYLTLPHLAVGGAGVVSVASHLVGRKMTEMMESFFKGDYDQARKIHYECLPLFKGLFAAPNPTCVKHALSKIGLCKSTLRLPLIPLTSEEQKKLEAIMEKSPIDVLNRL